MCGSALHEVQRRKRRRKARKNDVAKQPYDAFSTQTLKVRGPVVTRQSFYAATVQADSKQSPALNLTKRGE